MSDESIDAAVEPEELESSNVPDGIEEEEDRDELSLDSESGDGEETEESSTSEDNESGIQARIDKLTRDKWEARRNAEYWRQQAEAREQANAAVKESMKTLDDFDGDEEQYRTYLFGAAAKEAVEAAKKELMAERHQQQQEEVFDGFKEKEREFARSNSDYMEVTRDETLPYTQSMHEIVCAIDNGPAVLYYLSKHKEVAGRVAGMPPHLQALELSKVAGKVKVPPKRAVTGAPPPPPRIKAGGSSVARISPTSADSDKLSDDEWIKLRRKSLAAKRRK